MNDITDLEESIFRGLLYPLAEQVKQAFISAMVLRMKVHIRLARDNGAEDEDIPEVINRCFQTGADSLLIEMQKLAESQKADTIIRNDYDR